MSPDPDVAAASKDTSTRLAYDRTFLAQERTQMAWVRTSLSLISFGFGIAKFYQFLHESQGQAAPVMGPRAVGMLMISIGLISLAVANVQHRKAVVTLHHACPGLPRSTAGALAALIMALGIVALIGTFL